ncbi:HAAS signaling domain-containing protein [Streptomyces sp. NPDC093225]|uniref:HAAS signaling domain-containing protein n=1 Tax=Streptomyces sp. NPDC093225 TaxID=3366034 RepID=UPI00382030F3
MNAIENPLVTAYLAAVERETAVLPVDRRAELLADLREHIEVSDTDDDERLRQVLAELGDPRTVAASALAEEPVPATAPAAPAENGTRTRLTVGLLAGAGILVLLNSYVGTLALIAGLVLLWTSGQWGTRPKLVATAACAAVPVALLLGAFLLAVGRLGAVELLVIAATSLLVPVLGAAALLRAARP